MEHEKLRSEDQSRDSEPSLRSASRSAKYMIIGFALVVIALLFWSVSGMPGMDHGVSNSEMNMSSFKRLDVDDFARTLDDPDAFVVNVHTPYEGEIDGTDAFLPYESISANTELPDDRATPIVLYCRTGRMSDVAARALLNDGYHSVVTLDGGMNEWRRAGRTLSPRTD